MYSYKSSCMYRNLQLKQLAVSYSVLKVHIWFYEYVCMSIYVCTQAMNTFHRHILVFICYMYLYQFTIFVLLILLLLYIILLTICDT